MSIFTESFPNDFCFPFSDPSQSSISIQILLYFASIILLTIPIAIAILDILLILKMKSSAKRSAKKSSDMAIITQLALLFTLDTLCWYPTGIIYITLNVMSSFQLISSVKHKLISIWTLATITTLVRALSATVLIVFSIRGMMKEKSKKKTEKLQLQQVLS